ncbi:MAG: hypothetical protein KQI35_17240 [Bacteroidetes bacterium]|nr:hypothetical protein [Bacteroidota bacterium]
MKKQSWLILICIIPLILMGQDNNDPKNKGDVSLFRTEQDFMNTEWILTNYKFYNMRIVKFIPQIRSYNDETNFYGMKMYTVTYYDKRIENTDYSFDWYFKDGKLHIRQLTNSGYEISKFNVDDNCLVAKLDGEICYNDGEICYKLEIYPNIEQFQKKKKKLDQEREDIIKKRNQN